MNLFTLKWSSLMDHGWCLRPSFVRVSIKTSASSKEQIACSTAAMTRLAWRYSEREFIISSRVTPLNDGKVSWILGCVWKSLKVKKWSLLLSFFICNFGRLYLSKVKVYNLSRHLIEQKILYGALYYNKKNQHSNSRSSFSYITPSRDVATRCTHRPIQHLVQQTKRTRGKVYLTNFNLTHNDTDVRTIITNSTTGIFCSVALIHVYQRIQNIAPKYLLWRRANARGASSRLISLQWSNYLINSG